MAKKTEAPAPSKKTVEKVEAPKSLCKSCKRGCKNLLMVVQFCGKYLP